MPVEPTVVLAVNIANDPGTFAFFLGAGISRAAGVPSGREILEDTCRRYYVALQRTNPPESLDLTEWAKNQMGPEKVSYSDLLEEVFGSATARQEYLGQFFENRKPTRAHECLAEMAKNGLARVFITTNFDRLLEDALSAAGVSYTVVYSPEQLATVRPREHSKAFILKVHGDYMAGYLRNTESELASLDGLIAKEFADILRSYGLVVIGYRGDDRGVKAVLKSQPARYGYYWLLRDQASESQEQLLAELGAKLIQTKSADDFCQDLMTRVQALVKSPIGATPHQYRDEIVAMTRKSDTAGVQGLARELHKELVDAVSRFAKEHEDKPWGPSRATDRDNPASWEPVYGPIMKALGSSVDNYVSAALAALEYGSPAFLRFARPLPGMFRTRLGNGPGAGIGMVPALLSGNALLAGAVILEEWSAFSDVALLLDPTKGRPWTLCEEFHHPPLFGGSASIGGAFIVKWLQESDAVMGIAGVEGTVTDAAVQSNVLLSVAHHSRYGRDFWWWGYAYHGSRLEPLVLRIAADNTAAEQLGKLTDSSGTEFRRHFYEQYREEFGPERYWAYGGNIPVRSDVLRLLVPGESRK